jgi:pimeloyl-ACP methyl ester carboxylesterase
MVTMEHHLLFLPGAGGAASFWHPLGALLPVSWRKTYLSWPGLGHEPHEPALQGLDDAVAHAASRLERPSVVVAQSMGGVVAVRLALAHPDRISHLVLTATSGGIDVASLNAADLVHVLSRGVPQRCGVDPHGADGSLGRASSSLHPDVAALG